MNPVRDKNIMDNNIKNVHLKARRDLLLVVNQQKCKDISYL